MERLSENKIILITRKSRLDDLIHKFNTQNQAKFYIEHLGGDFKDYQNEHDQYQKVIIKAVKTLSKLGRVQQLDRSFLPNYIFSTDDTIVVIGQDGLVANCIKYLDTHPLIAINPDPDRWDGELLPFRVDDLERVIPKLFSGCCSTKKITLAKATLNTGEEIYGVNDIFIGPKSHSSLRYSIKINDQQEHQSSSGIIVSTGLGSTGWLKSLILGANSVSKAFQKNSSSDYKTKKRDIDASFPWDANYLYFTVREPFPSQYSQAEIVFGKITDEKTLEISSFMPENGVIFSDGIEKDFLNFNSGSVVTVSIAKKRGCLVVD
ncbi:MAG: sugar kinase [Campylobacterota bacterium]|nr:sugar kinase [Campylobacterota bacterium]